MALPAADWRASVWISSTAGGDVGGQACGLGLLGGFLSADFRGQEPTPTD
jgi:hypothetical protein